MVNVADLSTGGRGHLTPEAARVLRDARYRRGLTVRTTAQRAGVSPAFVSRLERGERRPRVASAARLFDASGIRPDGAEIVLREVAP
jgi:transcriptional regulator with XRE-family HTH domain